MSWSETGRTEMVLCLLARSGVRRGNSSEPRHPVHRRPDGSRYDAGSLFAVNISNRSDSRTHSASVSAARTSDAASIIPYRGVAGGVRGHARSRAVNRHSGPVQGIAISAQVGYNIPGEPHSVGRRISILERSVRLGSHQCAGQADNRSEP